MPTFTVSNKKRGLVSETKKAVKKAKAGTKQSDKKTTVKKAAAKKKVVKKAVKKTVKKAVKKAPAPIKKAAKKDAPVRKVVVKKVAKKKAPVKKASVKKAASKKVAARKTSPKKSATGKTAVEKAVVKKASGSTFKLPKKPQVTTKKGFSKKQVIKRVKARIINPAADMPHLIPVDVLIEHAVKTEDPLMRFDKKAFRKATAKVDPKHNMPISSKSKRSKMPSSKKPLWRK